jgi:hypothetical protein
MFGAINWVIDDFMPCSGRHASGIGARSPGRVGGAPGPLGVSAKCAGRPIATHRELHLDGCSMEGDSTDGDLVVKQAFECSDPRRCLVTSGKRKQDEEVRRDGDIRNPVPWSWVRACPQRSRLCDESRERGVVR